MGRWGIDIDWLNWTFGPDFRNGISIYLGPVVVYQLRTWRIKRKERE